MPHRRTLILIALAGCASKPAPAPTGPSVAERERADAEDAERQRAEEDDGLELVSERGHVDPDVAAQRIGPHAEALNACYVERLARRKWLGGSVELTWDLAGDGALTGVRVATSNLGAWPVEKCLLGVARQVAFGKPVGGKPADVTFPVSFSAGSMALAWDEEQAVRAVGGKLAELGGCAKSGGGNPTNVTVTIDVGTRGKVQSVGFAAPAGLPDAWADCAEAKVVGWTLTNPRGKVAKLSLVYRPAALPDEDE